jgi:hypothetical protein
MGSSSSTVVDEEADVSEAKRSRDLPFARIAIGVGACLVLLAVTLHSPERRDHLAVEGSSEGDPRTTTTSNRATELATSSTATTTSTTASTVTAGSDTPIDGGDPSDGAVVTTTTVSPTTTTTVCTDSFQPGCGSFRWATAPAANQPMTVTMELVTEHVVAGEWLEVRFRVADPDATPMRSGLSLGPVGQDLGLTPGNCYEHGTEQGFGPWSPPAPRGASDDYIAKRRIAQPGTYWVTGCIASVSWERPNHAEGDYAATHWCPGDGHTPGFEGWICRDPYGDFATPHIEVVVAPAP